MATYRVYDNILIKLENVFLRVEMEVDREITSLLTEQVKLSKQLNDLKGKVEVLNSLKRSYELYCDNPSELESLNRSLFKTLCDQQIQLRFLQEKELLLNGYLVPSPDLSLPTLIQLNREYKLRRRLQEVELLAGFLAEDARFSPFVAELNQANEIFDLAVESGAADKLESTISLFQNFFEKVLNLYDLDSQFIDEFKDFRTQLLLQANNIPLFTSEEVDNKKNFQLTFKKVRDERVKLEMAVDKFLYQFAMLQSGKKIILAEVKHACGELESILFKEYAIKQKIQELRQYKIELNNQKENFMKDPTLDGYTEAVQQLESVENRFRRLMMHKNFDKPALASHFFAGDKSKSLPLPIKEKEEGTYHKILFQVLHNNHISSQDKAVIFRLSKPSKLLNTDTGKFFFQRTTKTRSLKTLENSLKKLQIHEVH